MKIRGSKSTNDITSLHSQKHHGLTDRLPITLRLNWPIRSITRVYYTINGRDTTHFDSEDNFRTVCRNITNRNRLYSRWWLEAKCKYWSVWVGFLYAAILVLALPPKWTQVSKNDILEPPPRRLRPLDVERSKQTIAQGQGTSVQSCSKVLGHFCISGAFSNSPMSSPSLHPLQTMLDAWIQNFFPSFDFV